MFSHIKGIMNTDKDVDKPMECETGRATWSGKLDFILSGVGYACGLGNIWRFPAMAGKNGGGAFLFPYFIMLFLVGIPLFFIEISVGQFSSSGPIKVWKIMPLGQGIGYGMVFIQSLVNIYYNVIMAWVFYYFFASFRRVLPWSDCNKPWNTKNCFSVRDYSQDITCKSKGGVYFDRQCYTTNLTYYTALANATPRVAPSEEFFNKMMQSTKSIEDWGGMNWHILGCLILSWIVVYLIIIKGIQSSGKVVYFTATFPYLVLLILVAKGLTLKGASDGIRFYLYPRWNRLMDLTVWTDAAAQLFFSLSCSLGGLHALSSYNKFNNNVLRDTWIITLVNSFTSIFAGFAIFSIIGNMSLIKGTTVEEISASGTGLAFIVYPEALLSLPFPPIWAVIFFFMLFILGIDSQFAGVETANTAVLDVLKIHHLSSWKKSGITLAICVFYFVLSIPLVSKSGIFWFELLNGFATNWGLILIALMEGVAIVYVYGTTNLIDDIEMMLGTRPKYRWYWWRFVWALFPLIMATLFVVSWFKIAPLTYGSYVFPAWANVLGWIIAMVPVAFVPLFAIKCYFKIPDRDTRSILQNILFLTKPKYNWGPALNENRYGRYKPIGKENHIKEDGI